jgi:hypothetical protein
VHTPSELRPGTDPQWLAPRPCGRARACWRGVRAAPPIGATLPARQRAGTSCRAPSAPGAANATAASRSARISRRRTAPGPPDAALDQRGTPTCAWRMQGLRPRWRAPHRLFEDKESAELRRWAEGRGQVRRSTPCLPTAPAPACSASSALSGSMRSWRAPRPCRPSCAHRCPGGLRSPVMPSAR